MNERYYMIRHKETGLFYRQTPYIISIEPNLVENGGEKMSLRKITALAESITDYIHPKDIEGYDGGYTSESIRHKMHRDVHDFNEVFEIVEYEIIERGAIILV